jgi:hypothetical protein
VVHPADELTNLFFEILDQPKTSPELANPFADTLDDADCKV